MIPENTVDNSVTHWTSIAELLPARVCLPRCRGDPNGVVIALAVAVFIGPASGGPALVSETTGIDWNVSLLLLRMMLIVKQTRAL